MERTCTPCPKIILHYCILQIWEVKHEYLRALTPVRKEPTLTGSWSALHHYISQALSPPKYVIFSFHTFEVIDNYSITDLTFGGSLVGTPPVLSIGPSLFIL